MDRSIQLEHLAQAEQHIAKGDQHIHEQELRIAAMELRGHDLTMARSLLETFRLLQVQHVAHRDLILRKLEVMALLALP
jgi:hypothetical protein